MISDSPLSLIYLVKQIRNIFQYFRDQTSFFKNFRENTICKTGILNLCYENPTDLLFSKTGILNLCYEDLTDLLFSKAGIFNLCYENLTDS